ncbi:MAG: type II restriction endonuclease [bacterium P3]|nr:MAG: type II restriction endonuclease [bacterium P3]KWW40322.1 MAG: type II restriction endonuclease [bacterium F083]
MSMKYTITQSRLLYVLSIDDRKRNNLLKVGEVFVDNEVAETNNKQTYSKAVRDILDKRSYMQGKTYHIEYVECTTYNQDTKCYKADDVYRTLTEMEVPSKAFEKIKGEDADIWFAATLFEIQDAIKKIKNGQGASYGAIKFRPEQDKAIQETVAHFRKATGKAFLWNAKMRFGKTLSGLEVAKEMDYKSTLIITHRPVVDKGWHEDFDKIFGDNPDYKYATRMSDDDSSGGDFYQLTKLVDAGKKRLVFFVSMQYLRLSQFVGGKERNFDPLKKAIMEYDWDFVMVDEAHEGIEAAAGIRVMTRLKKENTRILSLSGTPFNLLDKYDEGEIYTWDYVMEQRAKQEWDDKHFGDPNPYAELPRMQILTFTLPKMVRDEARDNNEIFKFHEFFRTWKEEDKQILQNMIDNETSALKKVELQAKLKEIRIGKFVYEGAVRRFLDKLVEESETSQYPFSTDEFRDNFNHTFWLLPGVPEAAALYELLKEHDIFGEENDMFHIVNVAGDGNIEDKDGSALKEVQDAIKKYERTITLSCGKLTTGVSVPEWTAVLCMKGSENTPAATYMQTIFRVQTHAVLNGRQKSDCYVFDFAPDRALTAVAETAKMAVYAQQEKGKKQLKLTQKKEEEHLAAFIKLCPVVSMDEGQMGRHFSANQIFEKLSNVYIERAVRSGYADNSIYNPEQLLNLTPEQEKALGDVRELLGSMPNIGTPEKITISNNGVSSMEGVELVKFIYYLTSENIVPKRPIKADETDENGFPTTKDDNWDDHFCAPSQMYPYVFISNSRLIEGQWTDFSKPILYKQWTDPDKDTDEAKKKREQENKEKRARMSVLRGVAIRIPLLVYGAEINDEDGEEITIDNFASEEIVDQASWDEFMPRGFTKETFNILKDCFDRSIFTGAAKRIRQMVKEADNLNTEDRIAKIATIFSYFHNPDKETVLTPWRVVNMQLSDCLGGWCFYNEQFDAENTVENQYGENIKMPRPVGIQVNDKKEIIGFTNDVTKEVFGDYNARILEINSKTGLYPLYMAYSIFKTSKEKAFREIQLTGERGKSKDSESYIHQAGNDLEIWKDVLQDNIFVVCRTKMAVSITKRTLAGFRKDIRMNVKCYSKEIEVGDLISSGLLKKNDEGVTKEDKTFFFNGESKVDCDMMTVLRVKPELFKEDVVQGIKFWHVYNSIPTKKEENIDDMKFTAIVGNPPYQIVNPSDNQNRNAPIYHKFIQVATQMPVKYLSMITPARWYFNNILLGDFSQTFVSDTRLAYLHDFTNATELFPTVEIKSGVCYFLWNRDYNGKCKIVENISGKEIHSERFLKSEYDEGFIRYSKAIPIIKKIKERNETSFSSIVSPQNPFGFNTAVKGDEMFNNNSVTIISKGKTDLQELYIDREKVTLHPEWIDQVKIITSKAAEDGILPGKVITKFYIVGEGKCCNGTYMVIGPFGHDMKKCQNVISYMKTRFFRFLVGVKKPTQDLKDQTFSLVPMQDFSESWTDQKLYAKYGIIDEEQEYIESLIKPME